MTQARTMAELVFILQTAIGPTILISGVGLLLLTMTNRFGRVVDRARSLAASPPDPHRAEQLAILWRRAKLVRSGITCAAASALCSALLIAALFLMALWGVDRAWPAGILFVADMLFLVCSLAFFIRDVDQSLLALRLEMARAQAAAADPRPPQAPGAEAGRRSGQ